MEICQYVVYAPHCSACFCTFDTNSVPLKATCAHLFCEKCVSSGFVCPYDGSISTIFHPCDDLQAIIGRFSTDDFDQVLDALYDEINTAGVLCRYSKSGRACPDQLRCHYSHGEELMQSMEPIFPDEGLLRDYLVIEAEEPEAEGLMTAVWRLLGKLRRLMQQS